MPKKTTKVKKQVVKKPKPCPNKCKVKTGKGLFDFIASLFGG